MAGNKDGGTQFEQGNTPGQHRTKPQHTLMKHTLQRGAPTDTNAYHTKPRAPPNRGRKPSQPKKRTPHAVPNHKQSETPPCDIGILDMPAVIRWVNSPEQLQP